MKTTNKIVIVGSGAVGTTFLFSAISQGLAESYGIIDVNPEPAEGNKLDLEDAFGSLQHGSTKIESGGYELVSDADILVITAGIPQDKVKSRLDLVEGNAKIMKEIAEQVKANGFDGVTIIASNPVDIMTTVYQKVTGFNPAKVISSSCVLDTNRLKIALSEIFGNVDTEAFGLFVIGEHGESCVSTLTHGTLKGIPLSKFYIEKGITQEKLDELHVNMYRKPYEIYAKKRATFYGIGTSLAQIAKAVIRDERKVLAVGALLSGEYGRQGVYAGIPSVVGKGGIIQTFEFPLSESERNQFNKSIDVLEEATAKAIAAIS